VVAKEGKGKGRSSRFLVEHIHGGTAKPSQQGRWLSHYVCRQACSTSVVSLINGDTFPLKPVVMNLELKEGPLRDLSSVSCTCTISIFTMVMSHDCHGKGRMMMVMK
jgi:hypothetical protein